MILKKYFIYILGALLLGLGISLTYKIGLGGDPLGVFYEGVARVLSLNEALISIFVAVVFVLITMFVDNKQLGLGTFMGIIFMSAGIRAGNFLFPSFNGMIIKVIMMITVVFIYAISITLMIKADIGKNAYDAMIFSFCKIFKSDYALVKLLTDGLFLLWGFLLGGVFNVCTILLLVFTGKLTEQFLKIDFKVS